MGWDETRFKQQDIGIMVQDLKSIVWVDLCYGAFLAALKRPTRTVVLSSSVAIQAKELSHIFKARYLYLGMLRSVAGTWRS